MRKSAKQYFRIVWAVFALWSEKRLWLREIRKVNKKDREWEIWTFFTICYAIMDTNTERESEGKKQRKTMNERDQEGITKKDRDRWMEKKRKKWDN